MNGQMSRQETVQWKCTSGNEPAWKIVNHRLRRNSQQCYTMTAQRQRTKASAQLQLIISHTNVHSNAVHGCVPSTHSDSFVRILTWICVDERIFRAGCWCIDAHFGPFNFTFINGLGLHHSWRGCKEHLNITNIRYGSKRNFLFVIKGWYAKQPNT